MHAPAAHALDDLVVGHVDLEHALDRHASLFHRLGLRNGARKAVEQITALAIGLLLDPSGEPERLIAGAAAGGFLLIAALAYPGGMGMGDVKLAGVMGLFLGRAVAPAIAIALVAGTVAGIAVIARKGAREGRKTAVPFGPFLALGALVAAFVGQDIVSAYLNHFG